MEKSHQLETSAQLVTQYDEVIEGRYVYQEHMSHPKGGKGASDYVTGVLGEVHLHA